MAIDALMKDLEYGDGYNTVTKIIDDFEATWKTGL